MRDLRGRTALVTGASRNIGAFITRILAAEGMNLVLAARSRPELEAIAAEVAGAGVAVLPVVTDVADLGSLEAMVQAARDRFPTLDVLVNNAGTIEVGDFDRLDLAAIEATMRVDLVAPMLLARLVLPVMLAQGRGHIVSMSSLAGRFGLPGIETYCAAKAGVANFSAALRAAYRARGVSASAILPGYVHGAGMYQQVQDRTHLPTPRSQGSSAPGEVARAVVRAIRLDLPEVVVSPRPMRPMFALQGLFPAMTERLVATLGGDWYQRAGRALEGTASRP